MKINCAATINVNKGHGGLCIVCWNADALYYKLWCLSSIYGDWSQWSISSKGNNAAYI